MQNVAPTTIEVNPDGASTTTSTSNTVTEANPALAVSAPTVNGEQLLDDIQNFITRYATLPHYAQVILPVWALHTHCYDLFDCSPYLYLNSPTAGCGKSRTAKLLKLVCFKPFYTHNATGAALYRFVDAEPHTLLIDEWDSLSADARNALTNILNSGYEYDGCVGRCDKEDDKQKAKEFKTFCPKVICGISIAKLNHTTQSRCLSIRLQKGHKGDKLTQHVNADAIRKRCMQWVQENRTRLIEVAKNPLSVTEGFADRQADIVTPLLAVAKLCEEHWANTLREALKTVFGLARGEEPTYGEMLLGDIWSIFDERKVDRIRSVDLIGVLNALEDRPWKEQNQGRGLNTRGLNLNLGNFGIPSAADIKFDGKTLKGFKRDWFEEAWTLYLLPVAAPEPVAE